MSTPRADVVALIGCSATKLQRPAPARELYRGNLFKLSVAYAERRRIPWQVLSAKWGVVDPDQELEPYDLDFSRLTYAEREDWRKRVGEHLAAAYPVGTTFVWLCGALYLGALSFVPRPGEYKHEEPLQGMQIGERMRSLKKQLSAPAPKAARRQCAKCPWKVDTDPHEIPNGYCPTKHANLENTIAAPGSLAPGPLRIMACHETSQGKELPCVGWLSHQLGPGNNIALRVAVMTGRLSGNFETVGPQHERFEDTLP